MNLLITTADLKEVIINNRFYINSTHNGSVRQNADAILRESADSAHNYLKNISDADLADYLDQFAPIVAGNDSRDRQLEVALTCIADVGDVDNGHEDITPNVYLK